MSIKGVMKRAGVAAVAAAALMVGGIVAAPAASAATQVPSGTFIIKPDLTNFDIFAQHFANGGTFRLDKQPSNDTVINAGEQWRFVPTGGSVGADPVVFIESIRQINGQRFNMDTEQIPVKIPGIGGPIGTAKKDDSATQQWIMHDTGSGRFTFKNLSLHSPNYLGFNFNGGAPFVQQDQDGFIDFRIQKVGS